MKQLLIFTNLLLFTALGITAQKKAVIKVSPLAVYSTEWNKPEYQKCNTAAKVTYMSPREKEVIYILNLARTYPALFANTVIKQYPSKMALGYLEDDAYYFQSLVDTMLHLQQQPLLYPDKKCYSSARCHAYSSGLTGYVGHERQDTECSVKRYYNGECCDYSHDNPLDIVLSLLIDEGVPSLGHRSICLGSYTKMAVSIQPHKSWRYNAVLDLHF